MGGMTRGDYILSKTVIELKNVTKIFPGVIALDNMSMSLKAGEIHGLIGENGAGKSTLIKVMTGVHSPEKGQIIYNGSPTKFSGPLDAKEKGIACVYQELNIAKELSITDNLFMGRYIKKKNGFLDYKYMNEKTKEIMADLGQEDMDIAKTCGELGIGQQQMVEIGRAILGDSKVIILDEPTSSLGESETQLLFDIVRKLKNMGKAILFVSHKLEEIFELCDVVSVMRDGKHIITLPSKETTKDQLISYMVGRTLDDFYPKVKSNPGEVALEVRDLTSSAEYRNISFTARYGEILGFAGLVGAGRTELFRGIFGADPRDSGEIIVAGEKRHISNPGDAIRNKIAFLTEDRKTQGLVLSQTIMRNVSLVNLESFKKGFFIDDHGVKRQAEDCVDRLRIKTDSIYKITGELSGGNQQKVVIGKWLNVDADVFVFDEPTRGIDVGAKVEVYNIMNELVKAGKCVIMVSSELPEILGMCDRVIVMCRGRITAEIYRNSEHFNQESIMKAAWGEMIRDEEYVKN